MPGGEQLSALQEHHGLIYSITWAPGDVALATASADFTAKVGVLVSVSCISTWWDAK
jgi:hypothetical protein